LERDLWLLGYELVTASSGLESLEIVARQRFAGAVLDRDIGRDAARAGDTVAPAMGYRQAPEMPRRGLRRQSGQLLLEEVARLTP
jgi:hypothetical protein